MIGDGMGLSQVSMMMLENGYRPTAFDRSGNIALIKTYSANNRVTDSAAAGTALASGNKTDNGMLGMGEPDGQVFKSIMERAKEEGYQTGLVVTVYLQHATPGAFFAHVPSRGDLDVISGAVRRERRGRCVGRWQEVPAGRTEGRQTADRRAENEGLPRRVRYERTERGGPRQGGRTVRRRVHADGDEGPRRKLPVQCDQKGARNPVEQCGRLQKGFHGDDRRIANRFGRARQQCGRASWPRRAISNGLSALRWILPTPIPARWSS